MTFLEVLSPIAACKGGWEGKLDTTCPLTAYDRNSSGLTSVTDSKAANSKTRQRRCFFSRSSVREGLQPPKRQGPLGRDQGIPQVRAPRVLQGTQWHHAGIPRKADAGGVQGDPFSRVEPTTSTQLRAANAPQPAEDAPQWAQFQASMELLSTIVGTWTGKASR